MSSKKKEFCEDGLKLFVYDTGAGYGCGIYIVIARDDEQARSMYPDEYETNYGTFEFRIVYSTESKEKQPRVIYKDFNEM